MIALAYSDAILYPTEMKCPTKKEKIEYKGHITVFEKNNFCQNDQNSISECMAFKKLSLA